MSSLEYTPCPLCGHDRGRLLIESGDLLHPGAERFQMRECPRCGHLYQSPRPSPAAIGRYYPGDYLAYLRAIEDQPLLRRLELRNAYARRRRLVERAARRGGRLLDVGCATGLFLDEMRRHGWQVQGVEPIAEPAAYARERLGLPVITGRLETAGLPAASFDVITLWDVLEHVHEPRPVLAELSRLLRPGGLLLLGLPNPDSLEARLLGADWVGWDLPRHLNLFRPRLLRASLASYGMPVERICSPIHGYITLTMSLEQRIRRRGGDAARAHRLLWSLPLRLLAALYYRGPANWYNLSSTMVVFARRQPAPVCDGRDPNGAATAERNP